jgi:hypothetical protein
MKHTTNETPIAAFLKNPLVIVLAAVAFALVSNFSIYMSHPLHYRLASDTSVRGKGKEGDCLVYASALSSRLMANGIHGRLIFYRWHDKKSDNKNKHVFVLYHAPDETDWIVDNEHEHPKRVPKGASPEALVWLLIDDPGQEEIEIELQDGMNKLSVF